MQYIMLNRSYKTSQSNNDFRKQIDRNMCELRTSALNTGVDKGAQPPPNGRAKKERGHFYQMSNMYTCIAYLTEIRKFCSKNLVHKGANFEAQNALKLTENIVIKFL